MPDSSKLIVEFSEPQDGWLTVTLRTDGSEYVFFPSHVPYDSVSELVNALLKTLDGYSETVARWNDEPAVHEFVFETKDGRVNFYLYELFDSVAGRVRNRKLAFSGSLYQVLRPFWKGLRDMQSKQTLKEYEKQWREPFPEREMLELTRRVRELGSASRD